MIQNGALTCRLFAVDAKAVFLSVYFRLVRVEASSLFIGELRHPSILETPLDLGHNYSFVKPRSQFINIAIVLVSNASLAGHWDLLQRRGEAYGGRWSIAHSQIFQ